MGINNGDPLMDSDHRLQPNGLSQQSGRNRKRGNRQFHSKRPEISIRSREVAHLLKLIRSLPDVREDRVEKLRGRIRDGAYNVDAEKIAEKMILGNPPDEII